MGRLWIRVESADRLFRSQWWERKANLSRVCSGCDSKFFRLMSLFFCSVQTEPDWDLDIADDTKEECSKYGAVKHIYVDK